jgi:hypothetical protein
MLDAVDHPVSATLKTVPRGASGPVASDPRQLLTERTMDAVRAQRLVNPSWWAIRRNAIQATLVRSFCVLRTPPAERLAACYGEHALFRECEERLKSARIITMRELNKQVRWDGTNDGDGEGRWYVKEAWRTRMALGSVPSP